jgi:hypothetical protein
MKAFLRGQPNSSVVVGEDPALAVDQPHDVLGCGVGQDGVGEPGGLDCTQGLVIDPYSARVVDQLGQRLEQGHVLAVGAQEVG